MVTQALMALPALALWGLTAAGTVTPLIVYALVLVRGTVNAIDNPTRQSFVIELVGADRVVNAVSLNSRHRPERPHHRPGARPAR